MYYNNFNRGFDYNYDLNRQYNFNDLNYNNLYGYGSMKKNLFGKITGKTNFNDFLNNTSRTLNLINQAIPIVNQAKPLINNIKTMFTIADIIKEDKTESSGIKEEKTKFEDNQPTFFL